MNVITDTLPDFIELDRDTYPLKTDFKVWLKFYNIITDSKKDTAEKIVDAVLCCFNSSKCKKLPDTAEKTLNVLFKFFYRGQENTASEKNASKKQCFDFNEDSDYLYAAFFQEYGIDLTRSNMHWYLFISLLKGLTDRTQLKRIISIRSIDLSEISDTKRRDYYRKMQTFYRLSNNPALSGESIAVSLEKCFDA